MPHGSSPRAFQKRNPSCWEVVRTEVLSRPYEGKFEGAPAVHSHGSGDADSHRLGPGHPAKGMNGMLPKGVGLKASHGPLGGRGVGGHPVEYRQDVEGIGHAEPRGP